MEWRDVAMALLGIVVTIIAILYRELREAIKGKVDASLHTEHGRRITDNATNIGKLYSKVHDVENDMSKMHLDIVRAINDNHVALLNFLQAHIDSYGKPK